MKKNLIIWSIALILIVIALYVTKNNSNNNNNTFTNTPTNSQNPAFSPSNNNVLESSENTSAGPAADFTLKDLNRNKVSLSDYKGKKNVFINFWATWCPPCRQEMPEVEKIYQRYKDKDLVVLAVNIGEDKNTVKEFIDKNKYNFKVLLDSDQRISQEYNITSIPVSYFIDKSGNITAKRVGAMSEEQMKAYIKSLNIK